LVYRTLFAFFLIACSRAEPPTPDVSPSVALPEVPVPTARSLPAEAAASARAPAAGAQVAAGLSDSGVSPLAQTRDRPLASSPALDRRAAALWDAIERDEPALAMPFFFPLEAYEQVKDVGDPASDWKHRLVAAYERDIHALHARLADATSTRLTTLEVPDARARWVEPGEEWNKLGYFRVFGSKLRYEADGESRAFEIKSLISWRGEWYVVHLSAIR
jgi:hypothetical protein